MEERGKKMIELGKCPVCGDIFMRNGKPLPNHKQTMVILSNDDTMHIAICRKHEITDELLSQITQETLQYLADNSADEFMKNKFLNLEYKSRK